ncbi:MAG: CDP-alcohol phosphatidyltransferase family protein [Oleiphilaceae bacterium]|nr:CDP-alcohol phosphatidyltransferase family protein [Oleiphilaceae bacterium]
MPFELRQIPNLLTVLRILLIIPFAWCVYSAEYAYALGIFFIAGLSDGVDGFLARQFGWGSRFGAIADPLADKLLLITAYVVLAWTSQIPVWLTVLVLSRDLVIVAGALVYHYWISHYEIKPSLWGKACTLVQIVFALAVLIRQAQWPMPEWVIIGGVWLVALVTVSSGAHYVWAWSRRGWKTLHDDEQ